MATNILFLYNNLFDLATLTESSEAAGFVAENTQHPFRTKKWTTEGATAGTANLVIDHGSAKAVNCVALIDYDWASAPGTFNLEFNATDSWAGPSVTEALTWKVNPTVNGNRATIIKTFTSHSYQYNRLNVVYSPGATPTDWDLGRIFLGAYFSPTHTCLENDSPEFVDESIVMSAPGGQRHVDQRALYRRKRFSFLAETQAQWELFQTMINHVGIHKNLFIAFDYDSESDEQTIYGRFSKALIATNNLKTQFRMDFEFEEAV